MSEKTIKPKSRWIAYVGLAIIFAALVIWIAVDTIEENDQTVYIIVEKTINNNMSYAIYYDNYFPNQHYEKEIFFIGWCDYNGMAEEILKKISFVERPIKVLIPKNLEDQISINTPSLYKSVWVEYY